MIFVGTDSLGDVDDVAQQGARTREGNLLTDGF
jgi:hypothetical protein